VSILAVSAVVLSKAELKLRHPKETDMKIRIVVLALLAGVTASVFAASPSAPATNATAAFEKLKGLVGSWQGESNMGKTEITYELTAGGKVLLERMTDEAKHDTMLTTYYLDGDHLSLTHYCLLGNEPHMVARKIDLESGEIIFDFAGAGNLASRDAQHMHTATIRLLDADHFTGLWTMFENNKPKLTVTAQYTRVK
jgi:hypothetical protein